jgi:hypothetical protein
MKILAAVVVAMLAACGGSPCDPCPDSAREEHDTVHVQLGTYDVVRCFRADGSTLTFQEPQNDAACSDTARAWLEFSR